MAVSAKSVIHYTKSLEFLKGILEKGFRLKYCSECIEITNHKKPMRVAFPMVSFCDIPLSEVKEHTRNYGNYGIGLSKKWAKETGLNPVFYINPNSPICKNFDDQMDKIVNREKKDDKVYEFWANAVVETFSYIKNIEGNITQGGEQIQNYQFYDEREWRWIPSKKVLGELPFFIEAKVYENDKAHHNKPLEDIFLRFNVSDISYIIVDKEDDIIEVIKHIHSIFEETHTVRQLQILTTKIISLENIANDF